MIKTRVNTGFYLKIFRIFLLNSIDQKMKTPICLIIGQSSSSPFWGSLISTLLQILVAFGLFVVIRQVVLWYFRLNTIVANQELLLKEQQLTNELLKEQLALLQKPTETK